MNNKNKLIEKGKIRKHPLYNIWYKMKLRCTNLKCKDFKYYGMRGIRLCDEWTSSFVFVNWGVSNGWKHGLEIDRIDNNGNYEPSNCQFITHLSNMKPGKRRKYTNNSSGYIGVAVREYGRKFRSYIEVDGKRINLGTYNYIESAIQARKNAEIIYFGKYVTEKENNKNSLKR